jgi:hypothetical protein
VFLPPTGNKLKILYLLALFQLVAGPLVLLQVTVLFKLTSRETPSRGVTVAFKKAWSSNEFQATFELPEAHRQDRFKSPLPTKDPAGKLLTMKMPVTFWHQDPLVLVITSELVPCSDWERMWTPTWPQAPPGPPPRVG